MPDNIIPQSVWILAALTALLAIGLAWKGRMIQVHALSFAKRTRRQWPRQTVLEEKSLAWLIFASGSVKVAGLVRDISRQGLCLVMEDMLPNIPTDCEVEILLDPKCMHNPSPQPHSGTIRWSNGNTLGIKLNDLLPRKPILSGQRIEFDRVAS